MRDSIEEEVRKGPRRPSGVFWLALLVAALFAIAAAIALCARVFMVLLFGQCEAALKDDRSLEIFMAKEMMYSSKNEDFWRQTTRTRTFVAVSFSIREHL